MPEVGVALALRQSNSLLAQDEGPMQRAKSKKAKPRRGGNEKLSSKRHKPSTNSSWQLLLEGSALYVGCLWLPSIVRVLVRFYQLGWEDDGIFRHAFEYSCSFAWVANTILFRSCPSVTGGGDTVDLETTSVSLTDAIAPDAGISDLGIVILLSTSMAIIRVALYHFLVPRYLEQPQRLEALVRCKSIHLLSSQYPGTVTPRSSVKQKITLDGASKALDELPHLPLLGVDRASRLTTIDGANRESITSSLRPPSQGSTSLSKFPPTIEQTTGSNAPLDDGDDWLLLDEVEQDEAVEETEPAPAVSSGLLTSSSAQSLQALLQQATATVPSAAGGTSGEHPTISTPRMDRLYAAPKYATAVFRLMYCVACVTIALFYFVRADFWPPAVGGSGLTKNCWDLSSIGASVMDSDFDQHNSVLRRYFLVQVSYHIHSGAFHIVASLLLWFVSATSKSKTPTSETKPKIFGIIPSGTVINLRQFFQHLFAVVLIAGTYLFSSMRRLAAVGMFAFDVSSLFLHMLQLCINAPPNQKQSSPALVSFLYRGLVIPSFCYSRFYVFPFVLGYSAIVESQDWLRQLENMSIPGVAKAIQLMFVVWLCLLMVMNLIYIKRLLYHPHILRALNESQADAK